MGSSPRGRGVLVWFRDYLNQCVCISRRTSLKAALACAALAAASPRFPCLPICSNSWHSCDKRSAPKADPIDRSVCAARCSAGRSPSFAAQLATVSSFVAFSRNVANKSLKDAGSSSPGPLCNAYKTAPSTMGSLSFSGTAFVASVLDGKHWRRTVSSFARRAGWLR